MRKSEAGEEALSGLGQSAAAKAQGHAESSNRADAFAAVRLRGRASNACSCRSMRGYFSRAGGPREKKKKKTPFCSRDGTIVATSSWLGQDDDAGTLHVVTSQEGPTLRLAGKVRGLVVAAKLLKH